VPEVARLNDEDTPDDDVCEEDIKPVNRKKQKTKGLNEKTQKPAVVQKRINQEDEANLSLVQDEYYKVADKGKINSRQNPREERPDGEEERIM
jgi:hypothetical protein